MAFTFEKTKIPGIIVIQPQVFGDSRGYFMESFKKSDFAAAGIDKEFVQDNESSSTKGVLRGTSKYFSVVLKVPSVSCTQN